METESKALVLHEPEPLVFALDGEQMRTAQTQMVLWLNARMKIERARHRELAENLRIATANKWRVSGIRNAVAVAAKKLQFFGKFKAAVEAGYQPIPDLRMDIFAVRTERTKPRPQINETTATHEDPFIQDENAQRLPAGEGEYRNPSQLVRRKTHKEIRDSKEVTVITVSTTAFQDCLDFPFTLVKPELLNEAQRALALKIFDEVGVIQPNSGKDPIIAGRILNPRTYGRNALFLIGWYVDMSEWK